MNDYNDYNYVAGLVRRIYMAARDRNSSDAQNCIISEIELISELARNKCKWGECPYIMHTLLLALRPMNVSDILEKMSDEQIDMLKAGVRASMSLPYPKKDISRKEYDACKHKKSSKNFDKTTNDKNLNSCRRNAAECALLIADRWEIAKEEMDKWAKEFGFSQDKTLIQEIIPTTISQEPTMPEPQSPVVIQPQPTQRKRGRPAGSKNTKEVQPVAQPNKIRTSNPIRNVLITGNNKTYWSISKLSQYLNIPENIILDFKDKNPETQPWFESFGNDDVLYFEEKYKDELQKLITKKQNEQKSSGKQPEDLQKGTKSIPQKHNIIPKNWWPLDDVAAYLGISRNTFNVKKSNLLNSSSIKEDSKKVIRAWFKFFDGVLFFDSLNIEALRDVMYPKQKKSATVSQNQPTTQVPKEIIEPIPEPMVEQVQTQDTTEQKPIIAPAKIGTGNIEDQLPVIEKPTNFPELLGMEAYLKKIQEILALQTEVQKSAQEIYDFFDNGAKQALEILTIVKQHREDSKEAMDSALALRNQYLLAERNAKNADQLLQESKTAIAQFLAERSNPNQKN